MQSQNYVLIMPALIKTVHFSNERRVRLIPNRKDLMNDNLIEELWWSPCDRAIFRREAAIETVNEYYKLSIDQRDIIKFDLFTKQYWYHFRPPEPILDVSQNRIIFE
jgi:hypothetical protein